MIATDDIGRYGPPALRAMCELLPVPLEPRQQLMELDNPLVRLELVGDVLERTAIAP